MITVMTSLIELRGKLKYLYGRYSSYADIVLKFILALGVILGLNKTLGYMSFLTNPFIVIILSVICAILPPSATLFVAAVVLVVHCYALNIAIAGAAFALIILLVILYLRFADGAAIQLLLTPFTVAFHIPAVMPVGAGLLCNATSGFSIACGIIIYRFIKSIQENADSLDGMELNEIPDKFKLVFGTMMQDQELYLMLIACVLVVLAVYFIRRMTIDYAWRIAIIVGSFLYLFVMIIGGLFLGVPLSVGTMVTGTLVSCLLSFILDFFVFNVDYTRTENIQFEDDDYVYFVRAVPKIAIEAADRQVKTIRDSDLDHERNQSDVNTDDVAKIYNEMKPVREQQIRRSEDEERLRLRAQMQRQNEEPVLDRSNLDGYDFESKLEESLRETLDAK